MRILFLLLMLFPCFAVSAQIQEIQIDIDKRQFGERLPFDRRFKIKGTHPSKKKGVIFKLEITPSEPDKVKKYFNTDVSILEGEFRSDTDGAFKSCVIGPFRPNVNYTFKFKTSTPIIIDKSSQEYINVKAEIYDIVDDAMKSLSSQEDIKNLNNLVTNKFVAFLSNQEKKGLNRDKIVTANGEKFAIRVFRDLNLDDLRAAKKNKKDAENNKITTLKDYANNYDRNKGVINQVKAKLDNNDPFDKELISILSTVEGLDKFTEKHFVENLKSYSGKFGNIYFEKIKDKFTSAENTMAKQLIFDGIISKLDEIEDEHAKIKLNASAIILLENGLNDFLLKDLLIAEDFFIEDSAEIDVTSEKTPYVSLDVGFNFRPGDVLNQFLMYQGANIYLSPVDKRAPLEYFKLGPKLLKMLSINIGVAQRVGTLSNPAFQGSLSGSSYFLLGTGLRVNRIFKLNGNLIFFKLNAQNPTIEHPRLKAYPFFSFSIDADVFKALGKVGSTLGLNNSN